MQTLTRYASLYMHFFSAQMKSMIEYRMDFIIGIASVFIQQFGSIFFVKVVFNHIPSLNGWTFPEVLFIYAIASTGRSIHHIFFDNLWNFGRGYIRNGRFDQVLLRPVNPLFHIIADRVQQDGFGQLLIGVILLAISMTDLHLQLGFVRVLLLLLMIASSGFVYVAINLFFTAFSFWMVDSLPLIFTAFQISDFARYPITIYNKYLRILMTWVIPYGFTAFYPASVFIHGSGFTTIGLFSPLIALLACILAYMTWLRGLRSFVSTGT